MKHESIAILKILRFIQIFFSVFEHTFPPTQWNHGDKLALRTAHDIRLNDVILTDKSFMADEGMRTF
jgi:hypothetical protein